MKSTPGNKNSFSKSTTRGTVSPSVIQRLPRYFRYLRILMREGKTRISSSELYQVYRTYCTETNEYIRSTADFYSALEKAGFERLVIERKRYFRGIKLKPEFDDFLS